MTGELPRKIGLSEATAIVSGTMIGAGIFLVPSALAREVPSVSWILTVWALAGVISLFGAFAYAELGAMFPDSGGQYVFLREAYGPLPAFLAGWAFFLVIQSGSIAAVATGFAIYLSHFIPGLPLALGACTLILVLSAINYLGVRYGARVQLTFLVLKLAGIALLIVGAFATPAHSGAAPAVSITSTAAASALLMAFVAYEGWHVVAFVAGEISNPRRNVPLALVLGVSLVIVVYLAVNVAFLRVLSIPEIIASPRVAADAAAATPLGRLGGSVVALTIVLSSIGCANGSILTAPRIYFAQARDGYLFAQFARVHPRYLTPSFSIVAQAVWTCLLALSGSYDVLVGYVIFISWLIHAATVLAVPVLRAKQPSIVRPFRMWAPRAVPLAFAAFAVWFMVNTVASRPMSSLAGLVLLAAGVPVFYLWRKEPLHVST
jgi:APA family basic amino acid/polyamine antiporter